MRKNGRKSPVTNPSPGPGPALRKNGIKAPSPSLATKPLHEQNGRNTPSQAIKQSLKKIRESLRSRGLKVSGVKLRKMKRGRKPPDPPFSRDLSQQLQRNNLLPKLLEMILRYQMILVKKVLLILKIIQIK